MPHSLYRPGLAPSSFFPFGYLKGKLRGTLFTMSNDLIFAGWQIFFEITEIILENVFTNWITRLFWVMKKGDKYYTK
jgi:hypothetical protein